MATIIDGTAAAEELSRDVGERLTRLKVTGSRPFLATVLAGDDHAAAAYERHVRRLTERLGCDYLNERLPAEAVTADVLATVGKLNADPRVTGVIVLLPLPPQVQEATVHAAIDPHKDIEAVNPENFGLLAQGRPRFVPSTPGACFHLLDGYLASAGHDPETYLAGKTLVVVGRSDSVGKPVASIALQRGATVIATHSKTSAAGRLAEYTMQADVLVVATGVAGIVTGDMVKEGVIAIDVGMVPVEDPQTGKVAFVGDLGFDSVAAKAQAVTPVPGGVGPVTDVWLIGNAAAAAAAAMRVEPRFGFDP